MNEDLRLILSTLGAVSTLILIPLGRMMWKTAEAQREMMQMLRGVDGRNGIMGWKVEVNDKLQHAGTVLQEHGLRISRTEGDIAEVRARYHQNATRNTEALFETAEAVSSVAEAIKERK